MKTSNTPRLCAGPQVVQQTPTKFWNIASVGEDSGEIVLYGDVVARQPVDWWTGEPEPGLYIAPESFMEDLAAVKGKSNITIKINSTGGDLYTGIAIHNAIKGLSGHKVVIVEGIAASAASVIACAGDEVQVYPGSMVMIHGVAGLLMDYYTLADLKNSPMLSGFRPSLIFMRLCAAVFSGIDTDSGRISSTEAYPGYVSPKSFTVAK